MPAPTQAQLLRIFVGERDKHGDKPAFEAIVEAARRHGLAGATVLRGLLGFGAHSQLHSAKLLRLSEDLPVVIEIVDSVDKITDFLPVLDGIVQEGLVTLENVQVITYRQRTAPDA